MMPLMAYATEAALVDSSTSEARAGERAVRAVYYALVLWIPVETFYVFNNGRDTGGATVSWLMGILLAGLALIAWRRCFRRVPAAFWLVAWYLAVRALSQLWIPSSLDARFLSNQMTLIQMAVLFLISLNIFEDAKFREALLRFYGWWVSLVAVGMLLGILGAPFGGIEGRNSLAGLDPNVAAWFFALGALCIAGDPRLFTPRRFIARFVGSLFAISAVIMTILQTGSRGGLLVFVAGIMGLAVCGSRATRKKRVLIAAAAVVLLGAVVFHEFQQGTPAAARLIATWNHGDTAGRTVIFSEAWSMFLAKPLLGYGGANNYFTLGVHLNYPAGNSFGRDTHNLLLSLLTEVGLVGAVPFMAAIAFALWKAWLYGRRTGDAVVFSLMCALIAINASLTGYEHKLFWIVLAAAVACG